MYKPYIRCKLSCEILIQLHQPRNCQNLDNAESFRVSQVYFNNYFNVVYLLNNGIILRVIQCYASLSSIKCTINKKNIEADLNFSKFLKEF